MQVFVYRSRRKPGTYVYLAERDAFACLPGSLLASLGPLDFALEFQLSAGRRLAREDAEAVRDNLRGRGFHLQMPPGEVDRPDAAH